MKITSIEEISIGDTFYIQSTTTDKVYERTLTEFTNREKLITHIKRGLICK